MRPFRTLVAFLATATILFTASAQTAQTEPGDPPLASLITVGAPDAEGNVTISGAAGAVFPNATVIIRNLYTGDTVTTQGGVTGSFQATLFGPGNTPFWISVARGALPPGATSQPGSLPGGPGTIIYGSFPESPTTTDPITQLTLDGTLADWAAYPQAAIIPNTLFALRNRESIYVGAADLPPDYAQLQLTLTVDRASYSVTVDPRALNGGALRQTAPQARNLGRIGVVSAATDGRAEFRLPLAALDDDFETITLDEFQVLGADGVPITSVAPNAPLPAVDEIDGILWPDRLSGDDIARFSSAGTVAQGAGRWWARGRLDRLTITDRAEPVRLELDVTLQAPLLPPDIVNLHMSGEIGLLPVVVETDDGLVPVGSLLSNNGWSTARTPSGLAIDNLQQVIRLGEARIEPQQIVRRGSTLVFGLGFTLTLPETLPRGLYVPWFRGYAEIGGERTPWEVNSLLGNGPRAAPVSPTRLPVVLNVGGVESAPLPWALLYENPSDGSRGILSNEDSGRIALSNRVRYNSPTYILPPNDPASGQPATYPLEPYLLNQMPNDFAASAAPLVPYLFPGGRLTVTVTRPDGTREGLGTTAIVQNQLSTAAVDERTVYGEASPVDVFRLTTLNPALTDYTFRQYGPHQIQVTGTLEDVWGNRYTGGGTYDVLIAEMLDLTPGILPGTPFEVGDWAVPVLHIEPAVAADVTLTVRVYPLDGSAPRETVLSGQANRFGYFHAGDAVALDTPGEYVIDYEARYSDDQGRLWAGSLRSAGVIANRERPLIAHGRRGLAGVEADPRPAWHNAAQYAEAIDLAGAALYPNWPYHSGDVAWMADGANGGLMPALTVQDRTGAYESQLLADRAGQAEAIRWAAEDELPVSLADGGDVFDADRYVYFSAVRPGVTARQLVLGDEDGMVPYLLDPEDRHNGQPGAGVDGDRPGDYLFLFGGAVLRDAETNLAETTIYGALAVVVSEDDPRGTRVYPPFRGEAGGPDGGPLLVINGEPVSLFFHPTGVQPGESLVVGDRLAIAGQVAPTLPSTVAVTIASPSGRVRQFEGTANAVGYFYDPAQDFVVDEAGIWTVEIAARHEGWTSAGLVEPPAPTGGVPGTEGGRFAVYVLPPDAEPLPLERNEGSIPATSAYNFTFQTPAGWSNARADYTLTMPGYVLDQGSLRVTGSFTYQLDPTAINRAFPNYELVGTVNGPAVSDVLTLTIAATGTDASGRTQIRNRVITILHDRLISLME